jgi:hypothetical protein
MLVFYRLLVFIFIFVMYNNYNIYDFALQIVRDW